MAKRFQANSIRNFYLLFPKKHDKEAKQKIRKELQVKASRKVKQKLIENGENKNRPKKKGKTAKESSVIESKRKAIKPRKRRKAKRNCHKYK